MCAVCHIKRLNDDTTELLVIPNFAYVLPDGSRASASPTIAWCHQCRSFVPAEFITTLDCLNQWTKDASVSPYSEEVRFIVNGDESARKRIICEAEKEKEWLALRKSPPKCLRCGAHQIQSIPNDGSTFSHPRSGLAMSVSEGFGSTAIDNMLYLLDIEGHRIGETRMAY